MILTGGTPVLGRLFLARHRSRWFFVSPGHQTKLELLEDVGGPQPRLENQAVGRKPHHSVSSPDRSWMDMGSVASCTWILHSLQPVALVRSAPRRCSMEFYAARCLVGDWRSSFSERSKQNQVVHPISCDNPIHSLMIYAEKATDRAIGSSKCPSVFKASSKSWLILNQVMKHPVVVPTK